MTTTLEQYALGYHSAWERALHRARSEALRLNRKLTHREEGKIVDQYFQGSPKNAEEIVLCEICHEAIADGLLNGTDPFKPNLATRAALENYGIHIRKLRLGSIRKSSEPA